MIRQTPGRLYLADQRGLTETGQFRRYSTFNFGGYEQPHKEPFGRLLALNEETLAAGHCLKLPSPEAALVLVLPITGAVVVASSAGAATTVHVEEVQLFTVEAHGTLQFTNPDPAELNSFLHLWLSAEPGAPPAQQYTFELAALHNQLGKVAEATEAGFALSLGRFDGRQEAEYRLQSPDSRFFAFVLAGAFEMEGRLLHEKDGLALWNAATVELEALSPDALVLVLEF